MVMVLVTMSGDVTSTFEQNNETCWELEAVPYCSSMSTPPKAKMLAVIQLCATQSCL